MTFEEILIDPCVLMMTNQLFGDGTPNSPNIVGHNNFLKPTLILVVKINVDHIN